MRRSIRGRGHREDGPRARNDWWRDPDRHRSGGHCRAGHRRTGPQCRRRQRRPGPARRGAVEPDRHPGTAVGLDLHGTWRGPGGACRRRGQSPDSRGRCRPAPPGVARHRPVRARRAPPAAPRRAADAAHRDPGHPGRRSHRRCRGACRRRHGRMDRRRAHARGGRPPGRSHAALPGPCGGRAAARPRRSSWSCSGRPRGWAWHASPGARSLP
jgi:hypothetical protein